MDTEIVEIVRFIEPVDFNTEMQNAAAKAAIGAVIGVTAGLIGMLLNRRVEKMLNKREAAKAEAEKNQE